MNKPTAPQAVNVTKRYGPGALACTTILLILKYGFGMSIPLIWALAPIWLPITIVLGVMAAVMAVGAVGVAGLVLGSLVWEVYKGWRSDRRAKKAKATLGKSIYGR